MTGRNVNPSHSAEADSAGPSSRPMSLPEYARYGRQMILPSIGLSGQLRLRDARVLVVGAGGLGCPAVQYLAAAGVGYITVVDHDVVERSNLARQILHTDQRVGMSKAKSIAIGAHLINPHITVNPVQEALSVSNAVSLVQQHDIVLDCTDNVLTRYLISDAAVLCARQVVSGAAQGTDGQLVTLHKDLRKGAFCSGLTTSEAHDYTSINDNLTAPRGPCYRCLFPKAPRPETVTDCEDGGVLGTITGLVGTMQAFETINLLIGISSNSDDFDESDQDDAKNSAVNQKQKKQQQPSYMTLVSPLCMPPFRTMKIRPRRAATCKSCGDPKEMTSEAAADRIAADRMLEQDYMTFCGLDNPKELKGFADVNAAHLAQNFDAAQASSPIVLDVRPTVEYEIAHLPRTLNVPIRTLDADPLGLYHQLVQRRQAAAQATGNNFTPRDRSVYVLCRRGNDSRLACHALAAAAATAATSAPDQEALQFFNVTGGLRAWSKDVDSDFPVY